MPVAESAVCAQHPETKAVEICTRCGVFVCPQCLEYRQHDVLCPACHARRTGKASTRAVLSLVLGILGTTCGLLPGLVGLVLAYQELSAIERGEAPEAGRSLAVGGKIFGFVNLGLLVVAVALAGVLMVRAVAGLR